MFKTPSKRGTTPSRASSTPKKKKGLLEDGQWLCDCTPRQPALCLTTKKEGKTKGKRFYTCQDRNCEMFLWEDAAKARERDAIILHNCRSENGITTSVRPKTPEPAPPLNLSRPAGRKLTDAKITDYAEKQPKPAKPQQKIFKCLDDPRGASSPDLSDPDETTDPADPADEASPHSQAQNRQRSYLSQPGPARDISQTLRDSAASTAAGAGGPAATFQENSRGGPVPVTPTAKRKRGASPGSSDDDEFGGFDLGDSDTERQLARIADESARKQQEARGVYETPSARDAGIRHDLGLPTPVSRRPGLLVASEEQGRGRGRGAKRRRHVGFTSSPAREADGDEAEMQFLPGDAGDPTTPTPYRKTDALAPVAAVEKVAGGPTTPTTPTTSTHGAAGRSPAGPAGAEEYPRIAEEVFSLLAGQPVSESTKRTLRAALERHEMRVKGVAKGREAARALVAERDERIADLQARVASLENARRMDRERLRELREFGERLVRLSEDE